MNMNSSDYDEMVTPQGILDRESYWKQQLADYTRKLATTPDAFKGRLQLPPPREYTPEVAANIARLEKEDVAKERASLVMGVTDEQVQELAFVI